MTEILTESFCERCGTRYTFESARPKTRLKGVKVFSRGLKNFVLSDDTSMDEAMAAARSESDREASAHQLDAFHKTFSFCMSCRQYTCPNCWNDAEARCLSCAPLALAEPPAIAETEPFLVGAATQLAPDTERQISEAPQVAEPYDDLRALRDALLSGDAEAEPTNGAFAEADKASVVDAELIEATTDVAADELGVIEAEADAEVAELAAAEAEVAAEATVESEAAVEPEPVIEAELLPEGAAPLDEATGAIEDEIAAATSAVPDDAAGKAASQTLGLLRRFRPGQNLDAELAAFERERAEAAAEPETTESVADAAESSDEWTVAADLEVRPEAEADGQGEAEPVPAAAEAEPVAAASAEPEPVAAAPVEAEPVPAAAETVPVAAAPDEPETVPVAASSADDLVEQPTWRITAPDPTTSGAPPPTPDAGQVPLQASASPRELPNGEPQWPARPEWPSSSTPAAGLPYLGRPATPQGGIEALWAASNQELVSAPQPPGKAAASSIQPCVSCGLSLSATARFCRRCGTLQSR